MHVHILGICGTFMGGIALIAREAGHTVTGSDAGIYPPMSTMLEEHGIGLSEGYLPDHLQPAPDSLVIGNALSRGNPSVEYALDQGIDYRSGPQWLAENVLKDKWVLAVSGTHGKTTTSSILAWILEYAGMKPGFLIGGVPVNFGRSARLGESDFFVMEADEYDSAFFDKRSKFVHFRPRTLVINNLEYDHADIFPDLAAIQRQFHHLVRTVPGNGLIIANGDEQNVTSTLEMGCWTAVERFGLQGGDWKLANFSDDGLSFDIIHDGRVRGRVTWGMGGEHNASNALAAILAARHVGVSVEHSIAALREFRGVKRRLELRGETHGIRVYDDFAHHPTAIEATVSALRRQVGKARILAVLEPRSNTMRLGVHKDGLADALRGADASFLLQPAELGWRVDDAVRSLGDQTVVADTVDELIERIRATARTGDHVLVMSNGSFGGIHQKLLDRLGSAAGASAT